MWRTKRMDDASLEDGGGSSGDARGGGAGGGRTAEATTAETDANDFAVVADIPLPSSSPSTSADRFSRTRFFAASVNPGRRKAAAAAEISRPFTNARAGFGTVTAAWEANAASEGGAPASRGAAEARACTTARAIRVRGGGDVRRWDVPGCRVVGRGTAAASRIDVHARRARVVRQRAVTRSASASDSTSAVDPGILDRRGGSKSGATASRRWKHHARRPAPSCSRIATARRCIGGCRRSELRASFSQAEPTSRRRSANA